MPESFMILPESLGSPSQEIFFNGSKDRNVHKNERHFGKDM
jgi:hypothetical protein